MCPVGAWVGKASPRLALNGPTFQALNCLWRPRFPHSPKKTESSALTLIRPDRALWLPWPCFVVMLPTPLGDLLDPGLAICIGRHAGATHPTYP